MPEDVSVGRPIVDPIGNVGGLSSEEREKRAVKISVHGPAVRMLRDLAHRSNITAEELVFMYIQDGILRDTEDRISHEERNSDQS